MMDNNQEAKMSAIKAFLNEADTRVGFLQIRAVSLLATNISWT